jgi:type I restriction enzyme M protein
MKKGMMYMSGAMFGDYVGSVYEFHNIKTKEFDLISPYAEITDDSYMTIAVASACLDYARHRSVDRFTVGVGREMLRIGRHYPDPMGGYGNMFRYWLRSEKPEPYRSWGNGSVLRVSPCGWAAGSLEEAERLGRASAMPTHNHPAAMLGARAVAGAVYLARTGSSREELREYLRRRACLSVHTLDEIRPRYRFDSSCMGTVPVAMQAFLESDSYEDAIRNAVSLGGDTDTVCSVTGAVAEAFYGFPEEYRPTLEAHLEVCCELREQEIVSRFRACFCEK